VAHVTDRQAGRFGTVAMLVTTLTAFAVIAVTLWLGGVFNSLICGGDCGSAAVRTPDELNLVPTELAVEPATASTRRLNAAAIQSAVEDPLDDEESLGPRVAFVAVDAQTGSAVAAVGSGTFVPASTTKVLTAFTVLSKVDPEQRFTTSVVRTGNRLVLVGGGDPYLRSEPPERKVFGVEADVETLAARTAAALRIDDGVRTADPAGAAAETFAEALEDLGVDVADDHRAVAVPAGATPVASVRSATAARITEEMLASSDNEAAEVLLRQAALAGGRSGSFADGVATVRQALQANGIDTTGLSLADGSGLSRRNRIAPLTLAQTIATAAATPRTARLIADLPVANFSGTLDKRFGADDDGRGVVRAKTGTLTGVHSLAGIVTDRVGTPIAFAVMIDQAKDIPALDAEEALDDVATALARCTCSARTVGP
jgi:D-alanyl-D-alanine carboxypeptidase/D-alanyl-D-alanine-endopeptidase (penicillin-binding protein 4)